MPPDRPPLTPDMGAEAFGTWYWMLDELVAFARELGLPTTGGKPALTARIDRRLRGLADEPVKRKKRPKRRDSDQPLTRDTPVVSYFSDDATRAFFITELGPDFHFTYKLNQFRKARTGLTYGDLIDEWVAERDRRADASYEPELAKHGKWNRFVRDFFADEANKGKTLADAAALWNEVKAGPGDHRYRAEAP